MQFSDLLQAIPHRASGDHSVELSGIVYDSRKVVDGCVFVAIKGYHVDGHTYIAQALNQGAAAIVYDNPEYTPAADVPAAWVYDAKTTLAPLAAAWHGYPAHQLDVVGITGTKGKTSTTFLTAIALEASGKAVGFMSTVDFKIGPRQWSNKTRQSTPESLEIQALLAEMVEAGCEYAVVESTSHGLSPYWNRLGGCAFDIALITNVTHEHLDYHGSVEQYRQDKAELFRMLQSTPKEKTIAGQQRTLPKVAIVNGDDPHAELYTHAAGPYTRILRYGINAAQLELRATDVVSTSSGSSFTLVTPEASYPVQLKLVGPFYVYNTLAALSVVYARNIDLLAAIQRLEAVHGVEGRMENIDQGQPFGVLVDYAHNPDSFEQVMSMMRPLTTGRMIAVFGSAGERDHAKRAIQGAIAARWCDLLVLTDEDPRGEDPQAILEQIAAGAASEGKAQACTLIPDRAQAIRYAVQQAQPGDIVLLLGKGHEGSIIYADGSIDWNEKAEAQAALSELGYGQTP